MKILVNGLEIDNVSVFEEREMVPRDDNPVLDFQDLPIRRISVAGGISSEAVTALQNHDWTVIDDKGVESEHNGFNRLLRHHIVFAGQEQTIDSLSEEVNKFVGALPVLLVNQPAGVTLKFWRYFPKWSARKWETGENCLYNNYPYSVISPGHDSTGNPSWNPVDSPSLFKVWHGVSYDTALPFKPVTGAHDIYKAGEYMIWTDGAVMKAKQDTAYSPADLPGAWETATA